METIQDVIIGILSISISSSILILLFLFCIKLIVVWFWTHFISSIVIDKIKKWHVEHTELQNEIIHLQNETLIIQSKIYAELKKLNENKTDKLKYIQEERIKK